MPLTDATSPQPKRSRRNNPSNRANHRLLLQQPASVADNWAATTPFGSSNTHAIFSSADAKKPSGQRTSNRKMV